MTMINVGVDFAGAKQAAEAMRNPAPIGVYDLRVVEVLEKDENGEPLKTKKGNPMFIAIVEIFNSPAKELNGKKFRHYVMTPTSGNLSVAGFLVDFAEACGRPWNGATFDPQSCLGASFKANVGISAPREEGKTGFNNIDSFI